MTVSEGPTSAPSLDDTLFEQAFADHRAALAGVARKALGDPHLAEEAVQETFVRAWRGRKGFDGSRGSLKTWLFAIEHHLMTDMLRSRRRQDLAGARLEAELRPQADPGESTVTSWQVVDALGRLTPDHRSVVVAVYFEGRSSTETAALLGIPEGTVRSRLFYALKALHGVLGPHRGEA